MGGRHAQREQPWPGLAAVGKVTARRQIGDTASAGTRYYLLSQAWLPEECNARVRGHWDIEKGLPWSRAGVFKEAQTCNRKGPCARNLALLRKLALNLARLEPSKGSRRGKLKRAGWDKAFLVSLLSQCAHIYMQLPWLLDTAPGPSPDAEAVRNIRISRELLGKAWQELDAGDLLQASEKAWGAAAFALKAAAEKRRWFNDADWKLGRIADILSLELDDPSITTGYSATRDAHYNYYHHEFGAWQIAARISAAARIISNLEPVLAPGYTPPFVSAEIEEAKRRLEQPTSKRDQERLATGRPPMDERPPVDPTPGETTPDNGVVPE